MRRSSLLVFVLLLLCEALPATADANRFYRFHHHSGYIHQYIHRRIRTSWYNAAASGRRTACGARFSAHARIAASRTLPCGTPLVVTNPRTGKRVRVVVEDRGPARSTGRSLDLNRGAAEQLGFLRQGVGALDVVIE